MARLVTFICCLLWPLIGLTATSGPQQQPHIEVELISEHQSWQPGTTQWLGFLMRPEHHWHTYWKNPGDSGLATQLLFESQVSGVSFGAIQWPTPERIVVSEITNFGYEGDTLLMVPVTLADSMTGDNIELSLSASWLVCKEICIPGESQHQLTLPLGSSTPSPSQFAAVFQHTRTQLPKPLPGAELRFALNPQNSAQVTLQLRDSSELDANKLELFATQEEFLAASAASSWAQGMDAQGQRWLQTQVDVSDYFYQLPKQTEVVLRTLTPKGEVQGYALIASQGPLTALQLKGSPKPPPAQSAPNLLLLAAMALVGGALLNLMPCVFPVLSLKALSLVKLSGKAASQARLHGILYATGILASLTLLALVLTSLKQAGAAIGWGFQLQDPLFLAILTLIMVTMAASLLGAFEVAGRWMSVGSERLSRGDATASLLSGCLAVVVASPCMTPLMAPALGVALTLPFFSMLLILFALGLGLALPILLLTFWPALIHKLPKPGPWLDTFKQALAFPLLATAIWLLYLLQQHSPSWVLLILISLLVAGFCGWLRSKGYPKLAISVLATFVALAVLWSWQPEKGELSLQQTATPYSPETLNKLLGAGEPVFINMTADWCLTCKVNERVTFRSSEVAQAFAQYGVHYVVGDWTHRDPAISHYLDNFQHAGVPLYVLYDQRGKAHVLPQLLTPTQVVNYLSNSLAHKAESNPL